MVVNSGNMEVSRLFGIRLHPEKAQNVSLKDALLYKRVIAFAPNLLFRMAKSSHFKSLKLIEN